MNLSYRHSLVNYHNHPFTGRSDLVAADDEWPSAVTKLELWITQLLSVSKKLPWNFVSNSHEKRTKAALRKSFSTFSHLRQFCRVWPACQSKHFSQFCQSGWRIHLDNISILSHFHSHTLIWCNAVREVYLKLPPVDSLSIWRHLLLRSMHSQGCRCP